MYYIRELAIDGFTGFFGGMIIGGSQCLLQELVGPCNYVVSRIILVRSAKVLEIFLGIIKRLIVQRNFISNLMYTNSENMLTDIC